MRPGVHTMISAPRFRSAIWSFIGAPPYAHTACICPQTDATPRSVGEHVHTSTRCPSLVPTTHGEMEHFRKLAALVVDLQGELAGWREDEPDRPITVFQWRLVLDV